MLFIDNISKRYGKTLALSCFSYCFNKGVYALLGPNGSGKSTLMNIITGNLVPNSGRVVFDDSFSPINQSRIGYVPQNAAMYPFFSVYEMLDYMAILRKVKNRENEIKKILNLFDLESSCKKKVRSLSGGTKQRLAIALSFVGNPQIMIFDEPTSGLDPLQRIYFKNAVQMKSNDTIIIISTHIVSDVEDIADQILFLKKGTLIKSGTTESITKELDGLCWQLNADIDYLGLSRIVGNELRIISSAQPSSDAISVKATLDDYYLYVFGQEQ